MRFRVVADENVDHRVARRLTHRGHDVEHVDRISELGKGTDDGRIARYSLETDRLILTSDEDFLTDFDDEDYRGVLFIADEMLSPEEITDIVHAISEAVTQSQIENVFYVSPNWLD